METNTTKTELKNNVLERIEQEKIVPRSKIVFSCYEILLWSSWLLSVLIGALAIAVSVFAVSYQKYAFFEATHEDFVAFIVETLPYLWFLVLAFMILFAIFNLRHTKRGYRYPLWLVILSSLTLSVAGGTTLYYADMGYMMDKKLGQYLSAYQSQEKMEEKMWQNPKEGRLVGVLVIKEDDSLPAGHVLIRDAREQLWVVNIKDLYEDDLIIMNSGKKMKVLGQMLSMSPSHFHACGILPWMFEKSMSVKELSRERVAIIDRIYQHKDRLKERDSIQGVLNDQEVVRDYCAELKAVDRIRMTSH